MTDIGPTGGMSDGQIIAWLEQKSNDQYGGLHDQMNASDERTTLIQQLTDARAAVDGDDPNTAFEKLGEAVPNCGDAQTQAYVIGEQIQLLGWTAHGHDKADQVDAEIDASSLSDADKQSLKDQVTQARTLMDSRDTNSDTDTNNKMHDDQKKKVSESLEGKATDLGQLDQLALINIQQAVSDAKQTEELASNILSSREQTSTAILGNVRG